MNRTPHPTSTFPTSRLTRRHSAPASKVAAGRSLSEFLPLLQGEQQLLRACRNGEVARLGEQVPDKPTDALRVRAKFLRFLLLGGDTQAPIHEQGVRLSGAYIEGVLELGGCYCPHTIDLKYCQFTHILYARDTHVAGLLTLEGSHLDQGIQADRLHCASGLFLRSGFKTTGEVRLSGAQIGGDLDCSGGQFEVKEGAALSADSVDVKGGIFLCAGFKAIGEVWLQDTQVGCNLSCNDGQFEVKNGGALLADRINVRGGIFLNNQFQATGVVRLVGAQIGGGLSCGGQFESQKNDALLADGVNVKGDVFLTGKFRASKGVRLPGAQIGGDLDCGDGEFEVKTGAALLAERVDVKGSIFLNNKFKAIGEVRLLGAQIGSNLDCGSGKFEAKEGAALSADGLDVRGSVFLNSKFKAIGEVRLLGAQIGSNLTCSSGQFENRGGDALSADGVDVKGDVSLDDSFKAIGGVRLLGAQIGGDLICRDGLFEVGKEIALSTQNARINGVWFFNQPKDPVRVNASHMQVGVLVDSLQSWAKGSTLDGLRYTTLGGSACTQAKARLEWLCKQSADDLGEENGSSNFRPQPWRQLQQVLSEMGHVEDSNQIGMAFERQLRKIGRIGQSSQSTWVPMAHAKRLIAQPLHAVFGGLSGYGYRPIRLVIWMMLVWLICAAGYWCLALPPHSAIGPSDPLIFQNQQYASCVPDSPAATASAASGVKNAGNWFLCEPLPAAYATFSPLAYSLDILLPLVDLGQEKYWGALIPTPQANVKDEFLTVTWGHVARFLVWLETLFGWVGSLLLAAIVSGFARRTEE